jgi:FkbM family methyltransferase
MINLPYQLSVERDRIRSALGVAWQYYANDLDQLLHLRWLGFDPESIFDIGSSNTVWSVCANMVFPCAQLQLFEPLAELSQAYLVGKREHPAVCRFLEHASYRLHPVALGSCNATCRFRWFENNDAGSTSLDINGEIPGTKLVDVPMRRLDDLVQDQELPWPDLIKLDTQGSEMDILVGGRECLGKAKVVFIESWLTKGYGEKTPLLLDIANFLSEEGFDLFALADEYRNAEGLLETKDLVFVNREMLLDPCPHFSTAT